MRIYLDACCLNRPFDDQSQHRIRLESEAVLITIDSIYRNNWEWVSSEALIIELDKTPDLEKRKFLLELLNNANTTVEINENEIKRAIEIEKLGFKSFDALHISCAESANVDMFLTTDNKLLKLAKRKSNKIKIRIENPINWLMEVI
ncbi:MAG: PIN domain-containing protein [Candidatus Lokiarchaeota archaeon]|nr:PIN domain-containing protein [Candidatus Lokiarchaeota archaeon]